MLQLYRGWSNPVWLHSGLGYCLPITYEAEIQKNAHRRLAHKPTNRATSIPNRVCRVRTVGGVVEADGMVMAAGAWSAALLRPLDNRIPLESQRGYLLQFPSMSFAPTRPIISAYRKAFVSPMEVGLWVAGSWSSVA